jgi:hypothetical protein
MVSYMQSAHYHINYYHISTLVWYIFGQLLDMDTLDFDLLTVNI